MHPVVLITAISILQFNNYIVSYNDTIGLANYAAAVCNTSTKAPPCSCNKVPYWTPSANYTCDDYTGTGYDRGHLIPNSEYGMKTCNLANAVPMTPMFNRQAWRIVEEFIRAEYRGLVVYRGCDYSEYSITTKTGKLIRIPNGCYWVVTNSTTINYRAELVNYGYIAMDNHIQEKKLPWWAQIEHTEPHTSHSAHKSYLWIPGTILLVISALMIIVIYTLMLTLRYRVEDFYTV